MRSTYASRKAWLVRAVIGVALMAPLSSLSAKADQCGPLKQVASLDLNVLPSGLATVPVAINGALRQMLFDTAGGRSTLTQASADQLGIHSLSTRAKLLDAQGNASQTYVTLDSFVIGGMQAKNLNMMIAPAAGGGNFDGILGGDIMMAYDEEIDFANRKISYFLTDHCDGRVVHWTSTPGAAAVIPFTRSLPGSRNVYDTHIRFHVMMDGKDLLALLDTGAARTTISAKVARTAFNVDQDTPGTVPLGELDGRKVVGYVFKTIAFGNVIVHNPRVVVLPDVIGLKDPDNNFRTGSIARRVDDDLGPELTIGMDVIKKLHLYVATKEQNLYVTAANEQPAALVQ